MVGNSLKYFFRFRVIFLLKYFTISDHLSYNLLDTDIITMSALIPQQFVSELQIEVNFETDPHQNY